MSKQEGQRPPSTLNEKCPGPSPMDLAPFVAAISNAGALGILASAIFKETDRLRDEIKRLEAVDLAVADDPMARQYAVEKAVEKLGKDTEDPEIKTEADKLLSEIRKYKQDIS